MIRPIEDIATRNAQQIIEHAENLVEMGSNAIETITTTGNNIRDFLGEEWDSFNEFRNDLMESGRERLDNIAESISNFDAREFAGNLAESISNFDARDFADSTIERGQELLRNTAYFIDNFDAREFGAGMVDSAQRTWESVSRGISERDERNEMRNQLLTTDSEGNSRLSTIGTHEDMDDNTRERGNSFLEERNQARQYLWNQEQDRRRDEWYEEKARRETYPDIYGCPTELEPFVAEELFIPELYAVRGAKLRCNKGTHIRKLNLPKDHGIYITGEPMVHKLDCVPGDDKNITTFGVCESPDIYLLRPRPPTIILKKCKYNSYTGDEMDDDEDLGNVRGTACTPTIIGYWLGTHNDTRIVDNGEKDPFDKRKSNDDPSKGYPAVTTESVLVCRCGGFIEVVDSGQILDERFAEQDQL